MNSKSVTNGAAQQSEKFLLWNLAQMVTLLGVVGLVFVMLLLYQSKRNHDDQATATSLRLYDGLVSLNAIHLGTHVRDYTHWNEAVERLATAYDEEWWENNAGSYAVQNFYLSFSLAVDGRNNPRLISTAGGTRNAPSAESLTPSLRALLAQARSKPLSGAARDQVATGMVWFEDALHLAAAVRYLPETEEVVNPDPEALLVFAWSVPNYLLPVIGEIMEHPLLHRTELPEGAVGIPLILADRTKPGWVTWPKPKTSFATIGIVIPILLAVFLIVIFLAFFTHHARKLIVQLLDAEQRAQYQLSFHRIAAATATALTAATSEEEFDTAINQCLQRLGLQFEVDRSYFFQFSSDLSHTTNTHEWCADGISPERDNLQNLPMDNISWMMTGLIRDGALCVQVAELPPEAAAEKAEYQRQGIQSLLLVTTHGAHDNLTGFIGFDSVRKERSWRDDELAMLQSIAAHIGSALMRKQAQSALEQKNQELEQFVYSVSHDLKSPLLTVKIFVAMLRQELLSVDQRQVNEYFNYIDKAADKMQQLLDALLHYSHVVKVNTQAQTLTASQPVEDCLAALAGILQKHQVQVSTGKLPHLLIGAPLHFGQIWQNLIENAVKYRGDQAHPQIEIGATQRGRDVVFYVRDNGMGIAPEHSERIFNLFSQLNPGSDGSGLGLALVKKIVSIYQGRIWVESAGINQGSCFYFTLPEITFGQTTVLK